ncbi:MAG: hypothetical protein WCK65_13600 [Rhodospirillaceae bacterium]
MIELGKLQSTIQETQEVISHNIDALIEVTTKSLELQQTLASN